MGAVVDEFHEELAATRRTFAGRPADELLALLLVALEREQIVSTAYREDVIVHHLHSLAIPGEAKEVIKDALTWVWKDEEMHTIFVRGLLLRRGDLALKARAFVAQASGMIGGWAGSILHHFKADEAPLLRATARALTELGALAGKVPRAVHGHLDYAGFTAYCRFNLEAELTAALSFERMAELATELRLDPSLRSALVRMAKDEREHARIFEAFLAALDEKGGFRGTPEALGHAIRAVGESYVARPRRSKPGPIGSGGPVVVETGAEKLSTFERTLERSGLAALIARRRDELGHPPAVAVKPCFMMAVDRELGPITDPALIVALARFLREHGAGRIAVVESRNYYDVFHANRSVADVARYLGIASPDFDVVDLSQEQVEHPYSRGMAHDTIGRTWRDAELRIGFGKLRGHPSDLFWLTLAAAEGLGPAHDRYMFLERQAHRHVATMTLLDACPFDFALLDAWGPCGDGLLGMYGCSAPRHPRRFYAARDALALDLVAARHLGLSRPLDSRVLAAAVHWFDDPSSTTVVSGEDSPIRRWRHPFRDTLTTTLSFLADPVYLLASARGAVFMPTVDEQAFPPLRTTWPHVRLARAAMKVFFGVP